MPSRCTTNYWVSEPTSVDRLSKIISIQHAHEYIHASMHAHAHIHALTQRYTSTHAHAHIHAPTQRHTQRHTHVTSPVCQQYWSRWCLYRISEDRSGRDWETKKYLESKKLWRPPGRKPEKVVDPACTLKDMANGCIVCPEREEKPWLFGFSGHFQRRWTENLWG